MKSTLPKSALKDYSLKKREKKPFLVHVKIKTLYEQKSFCQVQGDAVYLEQLSAMMIFMNGSLIIKRQKK